MTWIIGGIGYLAAIIWIACKLGKFQADCTSRHDAMIEQQRMKAHLANYYHCDTPVAELDELKTARWD